MRMILKLVAVFMAVPFLMGAGGDNPPTNSADLEFTGDIFGATILLDPHQDGASATAKQATIQILNAKKNTLITQAHFQVLPSFAFNQFGCDISKTDLRFLHTNDTNGYLDSWIPAATLKFLFEPLGFDIFTEIDLAASEGQVVGFITSIGRGPDPQFGGECIPGQRQCKPGTGPGTGAACVAPDVNPGLLLLKDVVIEFKHVPTPKKP